MLVYAGTYAAAEAANSFAFVSAKCFHFAVSMNCFDLFTLYDPSGCWETYAR